MKAEKRLERGLDGRLRDTYDAVKKLEKELDAPPSVREVVAEMGLKKQHISRVHKDMLILEEMGLLRKLPISTRCFRAIGPSADKINWEELIRQM